MLESKTRPAKARANDEKRKGLADKHKFPSQGTQAILSEISTQLRRGMLS